jgi:hypothetical protein
MSNSILGGLPEAAEEVQPRAMTVIKTYGTRLEANLASIRLRAAGMMASVVGVELAMEGGIEGVRLLVPDEQVDAALKFLADR